MFVSFLYSLNLSSVYDRPCGCYNIFNLGFSISVTDDSTVTESVIVYLRYKFKKWQK